MRVSIPPVIGTWYWTWILGLLCWPAGYWARAIAGVRAAAIHAIFNIRITSSIGSGTGFTSLGLDGWTLRRHDAETPIRWNCLFPTASRRPGVQASRRPT